MVSICSGIGQARTSTLVPMQYYEDHIPPGLLLAMKAPPVEQLPRPAMRLLLLPAFHADVMLRVTGSEDGSCVEWRAAAWTPDPAHIRHYEPVLIDGHRTAGELLARLLESVGEIRRVQLGRMTFIDGVGFVLWVRESSGDWVFAEHAWHKEIRPVLAGLLQSCWSDGVVAQVNNAIADVGKYVGLKLPTKPVPERPVRTGIGMLGEPSEVQQLAEPLQKRRPEERSR